MKTTFFKLAIATQMLFAINGVHAQVRPTLEWTNDGSNIINKGPSVSNVNVTFLRDIQNPVVDFSQTFTNDPTPLIATVGFRNQQYSTILTGTTTVVPGLTMGTRNTNSNKNDLDFPSPSGTSQQVAGSTAIYNVFGANLNGQPTDEMFISSPSAPNVPRTNGDFGGSGTSGGFDTQGTAGTTGSNGSDQNFGLGLYTCTEPLFDISAPANGRYYYGDLVITFNRAVKDPVIHVAGLGGNYSITDAIGTVSNCYFTTELELVNGVNAASSELKSGNDNITVLNNKILNNNPFPNGGSVSGAIFGAATGSVKVTGTYTQLIYRVYMKGSPNSQFGWSANQSQITSASRDPFNGDYWFLSISLDKPLQQISGNVFYDEDAGFGDIWRDALGNPYVTTDGSLNGSTIASTAPGLFHANLLDPAGNVIRTAPIGRDGSYLFDNVPTGTYTVSLSSVPGTIGSPFPTGAFPPGWINTGQRTGLLSGNDGNNDGRSAPFTINTNDIQTQVNFGVFNPLALPATLLSFNGALAGTVAQLNWVVANEVNLRGYDLERSLNGVTFSGITSVAARGTSANNQTYGYNDNIANLGANKIYYRLKIYDNDGSFRYSNIVLVKVAGIKIGKIYPNPFTESVRVEVEAKAAETAQVRVVGLDGKVVATQVEQLQKGGNQFTINGLGKLASGSYFIEVITSSDRLYGKLNKD